MRRIKCSECRRDYEPEEKHFCVNCLKVQPFYSYAANISRGGNGYPECAICGGECHPDNARQEHAKFKKLGEKYVAPESY